MWLQKIFLDRGVGNWTKLLNPTLDFELVDAWFYPRPFFCIFFDDKSLACTSHGVNLNHDRFIGCGFGFFDLL